jgi:hypothetical protein
MFISVYLFQHIIKYKNQCMNLTYGFKVASDLPKGITVRYIQKKKINSWNIEGYLPDFLSVTII